MGSLLFYTGNNIAFLLNSHSATIRELDYALMEIDIFGGYYLTQFLIDLFPHILVLKVIVND
jgi:hypothetical protein